jgi:hypothetical protein
MTSLVDVSTRVSYSSRTSNHAQHLTASLAIRYLIAAGGQAVTVSQIRNWAHRGHVARAGREVTGEALYDIADIVRHARKLGYLPTPEP